jgi:hypothetical protein
VPGSDEVVRLLSIGASSILSSPVFVDVVLSSGNGCEPRVRPGTSTSDFKGACNGHEIPWSSAYPPAGAGCLLVRSEFASGFERTGAFGRLSPRDRTRGGVGLLRS